MMGVPGGHPPPPAPPGGPCEAELQPVSYKTDSKIKEEK